MKDLFAILSEFSQSSQLLDIHAFEKIAHYYIETENLSDYILDVIYIKGNPLNQNFLMGYSAKHKRILINIEGIKEMVELFGNSGKYKSTLAHNLSLLVSFLHEIAHAIQLKKINEENDFETNLLSLSYILPKNTKFDNAIYNFLANIFKTKSYKFYLKNHNIAPHERLADIFAVEKLSDLIFHFLPQENLLKTYIDTLSAGYDFSQKNSSPTERYIDGYCKRKLYKQSFNTEESVKKIIDSADNLSLEDRFKYGLRIEKDEFEHAKQLVKCKLSQHGID